MRAEARRDPRPFTRSSSQGVPTPGMKIMASRFCRLGPFIGFNSSLPNPIERCECMLAWDAGQPPSSEPSGKESALPIRSQHTSSSSKCACGPLRRPRRAPHSLKLRSFPASDVPAMTCRCVPTSPWNGARCTATSADWDTSLPARRIGHPSMLHVAASTALPQVAWDRLRSDSAPRRVRVPPGNDNLKSSLILS